MQREKMPQIFEKDTKIKLIEYGSDQQGLEFFMQVPARIIQFFKTLTAK